MRTCVCVSVRTKSRSGRPWEPPARSRFSRTDRRGWRDSGWGLMYDICGKVTSCWWQSPTAQRWLQELEAEEEAYFLWFTEQFQVKGFDQLAVKRHAGCLPNGSSNCMAEWRVQRLFFYHHFMLFLDSDCLENSLQFNGIEDSWCLFSCVSSETHSVFPITFLLMRFWGCSFSFPPSPAGVPEKGADGGVRDGGGGGGQPEDPQTAHQGVDASHELPVALERWHYSSIKWDQTNLWVFFRKKKTGSVQSIETTRKGFIYG